MTATTPPLIEKTRAQLREEIQDRYAPFTTFCADFFGMTPEELLSFERGNPHRDRARHIAMYVARRVFQRLTLQQLAAIFHRNSHVTIMRAVRKVAGSPTLVREAVSMAKALDAHSRTS